MYNNDSTNLAQVTKMHTEADTCGPTANFNDIQQPERRVQPSIAWLTDAQLYRCKEYYGVFSFTFLPVELQDLVFDSLASTVVYRLHSYRDINNVSRVHIDGWDEDPKAVDQETVRTLTKLARTSHGIYETILDHALRTRTFWMRLTGNRSFEHPGHDQRVYFNESPSDLTGVPILSRIRDLEIYLPKLLDDIRVDENGRVWSQGSRHSYAMGTYKDDGIVEVSLNLKPQPRATMDEGQLVSGIIRSSAYIQDVLAYFPKIHNLTIVISELHFAQFDVMIVQRWAPTVESLQTRSGWWEGFALMLGGWLREGLLHKRWRVLVAEIFPKSSDFLEGGPGEWSSDNETGVGM